MNLENLIFQFIFEWWERNISMKGRGLLILGCEQIFRRLSTLVNKIHDCP